MDKLKVAPIKDKNERDSPKLVVHVETRPIDAIVRKIDCLQGYRYFKRKKKT